MAVAYSLGVSAYVGASLPESADAPTLARSGHSVRFATVGDIGSDEVAQQTLAGIGRVEPDFFLPLGDLSYAGPDSEASWCGTVKRLVGSSTPVALVGGNHEDDTGADGQLREFASCLPERMGSEGDYPAQYYFDVGGLVRVVVISPDLDIDGKHYFYGGGTPEEAWLRATLASGRASGIPWIVVAMHKTCISVGQYACDVDESLLNLLVDARVDLVLHGHDHTYQRTGQLAHSPACPMVPTYGAFDRDCVVDDGKRKLYRRGAGTVSVVVGTGTASLYPIGEEDSDGAYVAEAMGANREPTSGFLDVVVDDELLRARFVKTSGPGSFADRFTIEGDSART